MREKRDEWERERNKRLAREEREREMERVEEHKIWEEGRECLWETQEEREACEIWRRERMGAARTRGRTVGDVNGGWW